MENVRRGAGLAACALMVAAGAAGQQPEPASRLFVDRVEVNVVNVEVFVTDREGRPVVDLTPDDFEVLEDGRPARVTNFYAVAPPGVLAEQPDSQAGEASPASAATPASEPDREPSIEAEAAPAGEPPAVPQEQKLHLLVYIDNLNIRPANRERVLDALDGFLGERAARADRIMLVSHGLGLRVVQPFTEDRERLASALSEIRRSAPLGQQADTRRKLAAIRIAQSLGDPMTAGSARDFLRDLIVEERSRLLRSTKALQTAVRSLSAVPGRKALLYVSDGLPRRPGARLAEQFFGGLSPLGDETSPFSAVTHDANAYQVTFYALEARGAPGAWSVTAERGDVLGGGVRRAALDGLETLNFQEPLLDMSVPTGGSAILGTSDFTAALERLAHDFDSYYSLGFEPRSPGDGRYHRIEVKVRRPGLNVRHRTGYLAKTAEQRVADRALSALVVQRRENPLGIEVDFGPAEKKSRRQYRLPLLVRIPCEGLTLLSNEGVAQGRLRVFIAVKDEEVGISDLQQIPYPVRIPLDDLETASGMEVGFRTTLLIRPGRSKVLVGVWDEVSRVEAYALEEVVIGKRGG